MAFLPRRLKSGDPTAKVPHSFYNDVDDVLNNLTVFDGYIEKSDNNWVIHTELKGMPAGETGDIVYHNGYTWVPLNAGDTGDALVVDSNNIPAWGSQVDTQITVVTDWRYSDTAHQFQKKTRLITCRATDTESGWTNIQAADTATLLNDFQVDTSAMTLDVKYQKVYVVEADAADTAWTTKHTGAGCT